MPVKLAAFVITFDRPQTLRSTVTALLGQSRPPDRILVIDNKGTTETRAAVDALRDDRLRYESMGGNAGPAGAAAHGLRRLLAQGYDWIYWGDDDDPPRTPDTLERLLRLGTTMPESVAAVGAVGSRWNWTTGRVVRLPDEALAGRIDVDTIAGGSQLLISATAVRDVGVPNEDLFFGFEEPEYCLRLRRAGRRLVVDGDLALEYRRLAGRLALTPHRSLRLRREYGDLWRQYYSTRNYVFSMRRTFQRGDLASREALRATGRMLLSWRHGLRYGTRFCSLQVRALLDGYRGKLGCTVPPRPKRPGPGTA